MMCVRVSFTLTVYYLRYYDCKRSAEKKEQKTIEAAGKVRRQFYSPVRLKECVMKRAGKLRIYCCLKTVVIIHCELNILSYCH